MSRSNASRPANARPVPAPLVTTTSPAQTDTPLPHNEQDAVLATLRSDVRSMRTTIDALKGILIAMVTNHPGSMSQAAAADFANQFGNA